MRRVIASRAAAKQSPSRWNKIALLVHGFFAMTAIERSIE